MLLITRMITDRIGLHSVVLPITYKINDIPFMEPITPHYVAPRLLKLPDIVKLSTCLLFYEYFNDDKILSFSLTLRAEQHSYHVRSALSDHLVIESSRTKLRRFSRSINGKYFWNNIPLSISQKSSKKEFKCGLTSYCTSII